MKRTKIFLGKFFIIVLSILLINHCNILKDEKNNHDVNIRISYNPESVNYGPIIVAYEKGFFNRSGYNIELIPVKSGREVRQGLAANHLDIGIASPTDFFSLIAAGAPVRIVAPLTITNTLVFVRPDNRIMTFQDFKGKKVQGGRGSAPEFVFRRALKKEGVDISDIEFIHIEDIYSGVALMTSKVVDVIPISLYEMIDLQKYGAVVHREWVEKGYSNEYWLNKVIGANIEFLLKNPGAMEIVIEAIIDAQKFIVTNREESAKIIAQHIKHGTQGVKNFLPDDIIKIWGKGVSYTLWYEPNMLLEISQILVEIGMIKKELSLDEVYDSRFETKLKSAHLEVYESKD